MKIRRKIKISGIIVISSILIILGGGYLIKYSIDKASENKPDETVEIIKGDTYNKTNTILPNDKDEYPELYTVRFYYYNGKLSIEDRYYSAVNVVRYDYDSDGKLSSVTYIFNMTKQMVADDIREYTLINKSKLDGFNSTQHGDGELLRTGLHYTDMFRYTYYTNGVVWYTSFVKR